jgi:predicted RNA binding protein YcfA (HicA-like mRNA interferase family)
MSPKFANLKPEEVIRALKKGGFYIHGNQRFACPDEASD